MTQTDRPLGIVIVGHVDHGKSTLIGRLLHDTGNLLEGKVEELVAISERRGVPIEWSFALDALQAERDQAITIETTRVWFNHGERRYVIIDAPGHREFVRNMLSGAADAEAAIVVVDVVEGLSDQTQRHAYLIHLLGIKQIIVAVNKMDMVGYDQDSFCSVSRQVAAYLTALGAEATFTIPISARNGANLAARGDEINWYTGPTILDGLAAFSPAISPPGAPLRLRVQDVYRRELQRVIVGRIDSGSLAIGDAICVSPARTNARVRELVGWPNDPRGPAIAGDSVGFTLDEPIFVERGDVVSSAVDVPSAACSFRSLVFWLAVDGPELNEQLLAKWGPTEARVTVEAIGSIVDTRSLESLTASDGAQYCAIDLRLSASAIVPLDIRVDNRLTSRYVLLRGGAVVGAATVTKVYDGPQSANIHPHEHLISRAEREERNGHRGAVIWLTGLPASGKSTLALALERRLFDLGKLVYVLDGDNVRSGLNSDLGFTDLDRSENIRRVGAVSALFADAGIITIVALISPFAIDRDAARAAYDAFHEVYVKADLALCESRDPKGLYKKARAGELREFTGVSSPYEAPLHAELEIDTRETIVACVEQLVAYVVGVTGSSPAKE